MHVSFCILLASSILLSTPTFAADERSADGKSEFDKEFERARAEIDFEEEAVKPCVKAVKEEIPNGDLDAYVENGKVKTIGSQMEIFKFEKCMYKHGHPLEKRSLERP